MTPGARLDSYLGAARVIRANGAILLVALEDGPAAGGTVVHVTPAFTVPYRPAAGDQLLVLGDERSFYAIGVLQGRGQIGFSTPAGVTLRAEGGQLRLVGDRGVRVRGRTIRMQAQQLRRLATRAVEVFGEQRRVVRDRLAIDAGEVDEHADGHWLLQAQRVIVKALHKARVKSTTVRMG